ncbi:hypothetical protein C7B90_23500, partial [Lysinibacillus fusiformis]
TSLGNKGSQLCAGCFFYFKEILHKLQDFIQKSIIIKRFNCKILYNYMMVASSFLYSYLFGFSIKICYD